jgi:hypothetical protein
LQQGAARVAAGLDVGAAAFALAVAVDRLWVAHRRLTCPCGAPIHLVRYVECKPDVPLYYCEYGELHQGLDPNP